MLPHRYRCADGEGAKNQDYEHNIYYSRESEMAESLQDYRFILPSVAVSLLPPCCNLPLPRFSKRGYDYSVVSIKHTVHLTVHGYDFHFVQYV